MRRALLPLLSAALLVFVTGLQGAEDDAKAILARAVKAQGGEEALMKYKAGQFKTKGTLKLPGIGEIQMTQEVSTMQPDKFKEVVELEIMNKTITVTTLANGDKVSLEAAGNEVELKDSIKTAIKDAQYMMKVARLLPLLKDKSFELALVGEVKVEGKPALGVRVSSKGHKDVNLFFNKETGLLAKIEHRSIDTMTEKEITEERIFLEYGPKGPEGIRSPKKVLVKHDGEMFLEAEILETKLLEKLDDAHFAK